MKTNNGKFKKLGLSLITAITASCFTLSAAKAEGEKISDEDFKINGQVQVRTEVDARDFSNTTNPLIFTSLRTSLSVQKTFQEKLKFYIQLRDSRVFGEETNTSTNIKNLDLHQGYVSFTKPFDLPLSLQVGRFEQSYGTQRFFGPGDWHYVGRAFDGLKLNYSNKDLSNLNVDFFGLMNNSSLPYIGNATPKVYKDISGAATGKEITLPDNQIYGFWSSAKFSPMAEFDFFAWLDDNKSLKTSIPDPNNKLFKTVFLDKKQATIGLNYKGNYGPFSSLVEAAYQTGKQSQKDTTTNKVEEENNIGAYLASAQVFYSPIKELKFGLGADLISGDPNGKINGAFETLYGTNHLFYGFMDYFTSISQNTNKLGLNDFYITSTWKSESFPVGVLLNLHHMMSNQPLKTGENTFGQEADLVLKYKVMENVNFSFGNSLFLPGNLMKTASFFGNKNGDLSYWGYLMLTAGF